MAVEPDRTRVELEHRGWERLGDQGPRPRTSYERGWPGVLEAFAGAAIAGAGAGSSADWNSPTRARPRPPAE